MANVASKISATKHRVTYGITGDGTVAGPTIANATLLTDMKPGPLKKAWNKTYADQAAMRTALLAGGQQCLILLQLIVAVADTTAQQNQPAVDVDVDAVTATKAEINVTMSDTTGQIMFMHVMHRHSRVQ